MCSKCLKYLTLKVQSKVPQITHGGYIVKNTGRRHVQSPGLMSKIPKLYSVEWRYILVFYLCGQIGSWLLFAALYTLFTLADTPGTFSCIENVSDFAEAFLFSLEAQTTIGFGSRHTNSECWYGIITVVVQSLVGILIQSCLLMIIVNKLSRPEVRKKSIIFSKKMVLYKQGESWLLKFRIGDLESNEYLMNAQINIQLILPQITDDSGHEEVQLMTHSLEHVTYPVLTNEMMIWPTNVIHEVKPGSPLYGYMRYLETVMCAPGDSLTGAELRRLRERRKSQSLDAIPEDTFSEPREPNDTMYSRESVESGRIVVLFNAVTNENAQQVSASHCYPLMSDLVFNANFENMLYHTSRESKRDYAPILEIKWDNFDLTKPIGGRLSSQGLKHKQGTRTALKLVTVDTIDAN